MIALLAALVFQCPDGTPPPCRTASSVTRAPAALSIAVLPFESRSPDSSDAYLAEGMTEEVANRLTRVNRLQVKARGLVNLQWRRTPEPFAAARSLGVAWFVHGNIRRQGGQLLVNVELVRATTGEEAWATRFPRRDGDVFAVQAEIAESVAVMVGGRLTPNERATITRRLTTSDEAYRQYLYGNTLLGRRTEAEMRLALAAYERAVALDPRFASAWARISLVRSVQHSWAWERQIGGDSLRAMARASARRAVSLDSTAADAWLALGNVEAYTGNLYLAHEALERALRLDSMSPDTWHFMGSTVYGADCPATCLDIPSRAIPLFRRALSLDPTLRNSWRQMAASEMDSGLVREAEAHLDTALSFGPWPPANGDRSWLRYLRGDYAGARADLRDAGNALQVRVILPDLISLATGDSAPALRLLEELRGDSSAFGLLKRAALSTALGRSTDALAALEAIRSLRGVAETRCAPNQVCSVALGLWQILHDPLYASLHREPRFQALLRETRPRVPWLE